MTRFRKCNVPRSENRGVRTRAPAAERWWPTADVRKRLLEKWNSMGDAERTDALVVKAPSAGLLLGIGTEHVKRSLARLESAPAERGTPCEDDGEVAATPAEGIFRWEPPSTDASAVLSDITKQATMSVAEYGRIAGRLSCAAEDPQTSEISERLLYWHDKETYLFSLKQAMLVCVVRNILAFQVSAAKGKVGDNPCKGQKASARALCERADEARRRRLLRKVWGGWRSSCVASQPPRTPDACLVVLNTFLHYRLRFPLERRARSCDLHDRGEAEN